MRFFRVAAVLALCAALAPLALAIPNVADALDRLAQSPAEDTSRPGVVYDAVIVLGGEDRRIVAAAGLVREGRARHVLYSGFVTAAEEARVRALIPESRLVLEKASRTTHENAVESSRIVAARGWRTLLLVTSAVHVPRALGCFRAAGLSPDVLPVDPLPRLSGWLPTHRAVAASRIALHELVGRLVYALRGYTR